MRSCSIPWVVAALAALLAVAGTATAAELYVAPDGSDANAGTKEKPFATLEKARDAARALKAKGAVTLFLRGGTYPRHATFALGKEDSGTKGAPVTYAAVPGEKAVLFGGTRLRRDWFTPVKDPAVLERVISREARGKLLQCDLKAHGITDTGELNRHGFHKANLGGTPPPELYIDGERMTRARWPNPEEHFPQFLRGYQKGRRGVVGRSGVADPGPSMNEPDFLDRGGTIGYAFDRPALWTKADDIWLDGVFTWSWEWSYNKVARIDPEKREITLRYGEVSGIADKYSSDYFFAENLLEEIDQAGEYYLDRTTGILYLLPPASFARDGVTVTLSTLAAPMVSAKDVSHVILRDLIFDAGRGTAISVQDGEGVLVERCETTRFSGGGVSLNGKGHGVRACHIHHVGGAGVGLSGGDPQTLEPSGCFVEDSDIHHFAWYSKVYTPGVSLGYRSVGSRVSHNRIAHGPHLAIVVYGNDHTVEYNDIGHVVEDFTDMGAIYGNLGSRPLERGTVIRRNYFHHTGRDHHLQNAVYPDNGTMGWLIEENVFHRIGGAGDAANCRAINNNTGAHIVARHNIFVDCTIPYLMGSYTAAFYDRSVKGWQEYFRQNDLTRLPHARKYPELLRFWDEARQYPDTNVYQRNLVYNPTVPLLRRLGKVEMKEGALVEQGGTLRTDGNWVADADPGFVDAAKGNFALRPDASVFARIPGFPAIPFDKIGPRSAAGPAVSTGTAGYDPTHDPQQPKATSAGVPPKAGRNSHPDAEWFPHAGFGWMMHWGIHTVEGLQPSWAMIKDYPYSPNQAFNTPEKYWGLAPRFGPQDYDPDRWMAAAKKAGFSYVVLTAKHHDGYAMWPTQHGDFGVRQFLEGRDLIKPYVEACRRHGLKVGLYFSQRDWRFPNYPPCYVDYDHKKGHNRTPPFADPVKNQEAFDAFMAYTRGQLQELLTNYGKIDLLWFDGFAWPGAKNPDPGEVFTWIRSLQPGIVINNRWPGAPGDFETPECHLPKGRPKGWWEACNIWDGHWGHNIGSQCRPNAWVLEQLVTCRKWGGNFLLNCSPGPDGAMKQSFYERCEELAAWMAHSGESLVGAGPTSGDDLANVPLTRREKVWYLHVLPKHRGAVDVKAAAAPREVRLLRTGATLPHRHAGGVLTLEIPASERTSLDDVVAVHWNEEP